VIDVAGLSRSPLSLEDFKIVGWASVVEGIE